MSTSIESRPPSPAPSVAETVKHHLASVCAIAPGAVEDRALLLEYGLDSVRSLDLVVALEERFGIEIPDEELGDIRSVADLVGKVAELVAAAGGAEAS